MPPPSLGACNHILYGENLSQRSRGRHRIGTLASPPASSKIDYHRTSMVWNPHHPRFFQFACFSPFDVGLPLCDGLPAPFSCPGILVEPFDGSPAGPLGGIDHYSIAAPYNSFGKQRRDHGNACIRSLVKGPSAPPGFSP